MIWLPKKPHLWIPRALGIRRELGLGWMPCPECCGKCTDGADCISGDPADSDIVVDLGSGNFVDEYCPNCDVHLDGEYSLGWGGSAWVHEDWDKVCVCAHGFPSQGTVVHLYLSFTLSCAAGICEATAQIGYQQLATPAAYERWYYYQTGYAIGLSEWTIPFWYSEVKDCEEEKRPCVLATYPSELTFTATAA